MSLRTKLIISYGLVLIIPLSVLGAYSIKLSSRYTLVNGEAALYNMIERACSQVNAKLEQLENTITLCAYQPGMQAIYKNRNITKYQLYLQLKNFGLPFLNGVRDAAYGDITRLCVYSTRGLQNKGTVFRSFEQAQGESWYERALDESGIRWYLEHKKLYALCRIDSVSSGLGMDYYGVLYLETDFEALVRDWAGIAWDNYRVEVQNTNGEICDERTFGNAKKDPKSLNFSFNIEKAGMKVTYAVDQSDIAGYGQKLISVNALLIALSAIVIICLVWLLSSRMFRRIGVLKEKMLLVRAGDVNVCVENKYGDEIGVLTDTFSSMLTEIRALIEKVKNTEKRSGALELRVLRAQIDPHFLYNTLSYVNWLAIMKNEEEISYVVRQISRFYRTCLNSGREFIHVDMELSNVQAYLDIQRLMHSESFDIVYEIDEDVYRYRILCFILQPIAENAVLHGIDKLSEERGRIVVRAQLQNDNLVFEIENNGCVLDASDLRQLSESKGYGIDNIIQRISLCYDARYGVQFEPLTAGGLLVRVVLPCIDDTKDA